MSWGRASRWAFGVTVVLLAGTLLAVVLLVSRSHEQPKPVSSPVPEVAAPAGDPCGGAPGTYSGDRVEQRPDGSLAGCLRVGTLDPGQYVLAIRTLPPGPLQPPPASSDAWVKLSPPSGPPGSAVKLKGYVPNTTPEQRRISRARLCWAGCDGLLDWIAVTWSTAEPGQFESEFTVPSAPWLGTKGIQPLVPGSYDVVLECIPQVFNKPKPECQTARLAASFRVSGPTPNRCLPGQPCASLVPAPAEAPPSALVRVYGWAPVVALGMGGYLPLALEPAGGVANRKPGAAVFVIVASAPFKVTGAPPWASLGTVHPLWIQRSGIERLTADVNNPRRLAYCAEGGIRLSSDGGTTWSTVPLEDVSRASAATNYPILPYYQRTAPSCTGVTLDPRHSETLYAVFTAVPRDSQPPPVYYVGYVTGDAGRTWRPLPVADGSEMGLFGGFRVEGNVVQAFFWPVKLPSPTGAGPFATQQTADGGRTWTEGKLGCPLEGPCIRLGAQSNGRCQAVGQWQGIEVSLDKGESWGVSTWADRLGACSTAQLVGLGSDQAARIEGNGSYVFLLSRDGGRTWGNIALPPLPDARAGSALQFPMLQMLPDGRLLSAGSTWQLLQSGASSWCAVPGAPPMGGDFFAPVPLPAGHRLWWLASSPPGQAPLRLTSFPLSGLHC